MQLNFYALVFRGKQTPIVITAVGEEFGGRRAGTEWWRREIVRETQQ
jgi:hypothetical protein